MQVTTAEGKVITLNTQQIECLELMKTWARGKLPKTSNVSHSNLFLLEGYAGTGKTTIISVFFDWWRDFRREESVRLFGADTFYMKNAGYSEEHKEFNRKTKPCVSAPTHRATNVISLMTGLKGKTIPSIVGLGPNTNIDNFDINNPEFAIVNDPSMQSLSLLACDEATMINSDLLSLIAEQAKLYNVKIIFMGDRAQAPPVKEDVAPVIDSPLIEYRYLLTKVERTQDDNPLYDVCMAIRENLDAITDRYTHETNVLPDGRGVAFTDSLKMFGVNALKQFNSENFKTNPLYTRILAYSNKRVEFWNQSMRTAILNSKIKNGELEEVDDIVLGEVLMSYSNYKDGIVNSAEYKVKDIARITLTLDYGEYIDPEDKAQGREYQVDVKVFDVTLENIDKPDNVINTSIVVPTLDNYSRFKHPFAWYHNQGIHKRKWVEFYNWKSKYLLLYPLLDKGKEIVKKDLSYAYALTIHKSQGGTFNYIYIDEDDINLLQNRKFCKTLYDSELKEKEKKSRKEYTKFMNKYPTFESFYKAKQREKNHLKYVAFSRTKNRVVSLYQSA